MTGRDIQGRDFHTCLVRGQSVRYLRGGVGPVLLWLRGTDASDNWRPYMDALGRHFDVVAPEHPGFGNVDKPEWLDTVADMANFYFDFLATLELPRVHLAGHGLGGWIAAEMAIRDARGLTSLTLVSAAGLEVRGAGGTDPFLRTEEDAILDQFEDEKLARSEIARRLSEETEDVRIANQMVIAQLAWSPRWHDPHLRKWLHRIDIPSLVIWGEQDKVLPVEHAHAWHALIGHSQLATIPACGHMPQIEKTDQFAALLGVVSQGANPVRENAP